MSITYIKKPNALVNSAFVEHLVYYLFIVSAPSSFFFFLTNLSNTFLTFLLLIYKQAERVCFVFYSYFIWSYLFVGLFGQPPPLLMDTNTIVRLLFIDEHKHRI